MGKDKKSGVKKLLKNKEKRKKSFEVCKKILLFVNIICYYLFLYAFLTLELIKIDSAIMMTVLKEN
jgi:hypothetical protein